jgi:transporter family protein
VNWLGWSVISLIAWGVWGVVAKQALQGLPWQQVYLFAAAASFGTAAVIALVARAEFALAPQFALPALAVGALGATGALGVYLALSTGGRASVVIPLTAAYPVITALLSVAFLREELGPTKLVAVIMFVVATILVTR